MKFEKDQKVFVKNGGFGKFLFDDGDRITVLMDGCECSNTFLREDVIALSTDPLVILNGPPLEFTTKKHHCNQCGSDDHDGHGVVTFDQGPKKEEDRLEAEFMEGFITGQRRCSKAYSTEEEARQDYFKMREKWPRT